MIFLNGELASLKAAQLFSQHIYTYKNLADSPIKNVWDRVSERTVYKHQDIVSLLHHGDSALVSSDSLIPAIPQLAKLNKSGVVLHVSAENAQSSFADFSKVMAVRQSGWALLCSSTVQEAHDLAIISHVVAIKTNRPVLHFFDSRRIAQEHATIQLVDANVIKQWVTPEDFDSYQQSDDSSKVYSCSKKKKKEKIVLTLKKKKRLLY